MRRTLSILAIVMVLLVTPFTAAAYQIAGGVHDRSSDPAYIASGIKGVCFECHVPHEAFELRLWKRDLSPDALNESDLCLDCHSGFPPPWASPAQDKSQVETSLHDFTGDPIAPGGVCSSCHHIHYSSDATAGFAGSANGDYFTDFELWTRDLTDDLNEYYQKRDLATDSDPVGGPNYLVGMTILCYDCHGGDARVNGPDDADFNPDPQDIAFGGDRDVLDGNVGYYELPTGEEPDAGTTAPSLAAILASPNDPDSIPGGHYVQSLMNNDGTPQDDNYEVRDPNGTLLYKISVGDKLPCELCHDPHLKESSSASTPPDEVFFRRDIYAGEGIVVDRTTTTGNYFDEKLEASGDTRNGAGDDGDGRKMCIYCHGSGDWDGNQNYTILANGVSPLIVNWTDRTTIYGIQFRTPANTTGSSAFPPPDLDAHKADGTGRPHCTSCHLHNNVRSANCGACHAWPVTTGAHQKHLQTQATGGLALSCDVCHGIGAELSTHNGHGQGGNVVQSQYITLLGDPAYTSSWSRPSWYDSTWGAAGRSTVVDWQSNVTCETRCHGNEQGSADGDGPLSWFDQADSATYNNVCFYCHNLIPSSFQLPATSGTLYQATNSATNYVNPISEFSRGGHGDTEINDPAWFEDTAPGSSVPLACVACHEESQGHFPVETGNPYRVSDDALNNTLPGRSSAEGPLTNLCTQTNCHPKILGVGDYAFLVQSMKHPSDHFPISSPSVIDMTKNPTAAILSNAVSDTTNPAYNPAGRSATVGLNIDRYVDHWGYWGAVSCTGPGDEEPFLPMDDPLTKQVGDSYANIDSDLITCVTCHNPHGTDLHVYGEGCAVASTLLSIPDNKMLRLRNQDNEMCFACHGD